MSSLIQTLLQDLDTLSSLMATNLTNKGVPSTANEGLTTLANKIQDVSNILYWNDGSRVNDLQVDSNVSCTTNGEYITITTNTSSELYVKLPIILNGNWQWEVKIAKKGVNQVLACSIFPNNSDWWWTVPETMSSVYAHLNETSRTLNCNVDIGSVQKLRYNDGTLSLYMDDVLLRTKTVNLRNVQLGFYTNNGRIQHIKDIKITKL